MKKIELDKDELIIGDSKAIREVIKIIARYANSKENVLILGDTGTGKEVIAKAIHQKSKRKDKPFVAINCTALPDTLLESELFGYEKGAFTGAYSRKQGRFDLADGGTIFLDEIGDVSPLMQAKILRVIQERSYERLGGSETLKVDVRVIAATNKNLAQMVKDFKYREDLYYRLCVLPIHLPSLNKRKDDIPILVNCFLKKIAKDNKTEKMNISPRALELLYVHEWPGNVRELENVIRRANVLAEGNIILPEHLPEEIQINPLKPVLPDVMEDLGNKKIKCQIQNINWDIIGNATLKLAVHSFEKRIIEDCLFKNGNNKSWVANLLGLTRKGLKDKITRLNIQNQDVNIC